MYPQMSTLFSIFPAGSKKGAIPHFSFLTASMVCNSDPVCIFALYGIVNVLFFQLEKNAEIFHVPQMSKFRVGIVECLCICRSYALFW